MGREERAEDMARAQGYLPLSSFLLHLHTHTHTPHSCLEPSVSGQRSESKLDSQLLLAQSMARLFACLFIFLFWTVVCVSEALWGSSGL